MAKNKKKGKKGKVVGGVGVVAILAVLALLGGKGLGLGGGGGLGLGKDANVNSDAENQTDEEKEPVENPQEELPEEKETKTVSIEVQQGTYLIDGVEKSLAEIEALLTAENAADTSFVLVDNYAATKEWDEIKALFTKYELDVVEQKK